MREETIKVVQYFDNAGNRHPTRWAAIAADEAANNIMYFSVKYDVDEYEKFRRTTYISLPAKEDYIDGTTWARMWATKHSGNEIVEFYGGAVRGWTITPIDLSRFNEDTHFAGNNRAELIEKIKLDRDDLMALLN